MVEDGAPFVYQGEIGWFGGSDYAHPVLTCEYAQRFQDTLNLDVFCSKVFLIVGIADLALPADGLFINTSRYGLGPGSQSLRYVSEVLFSIQGKSNVSQGALSGLVVPEFSIHQDTIMVEENVFLHFIG